MEKYRIEKNTVQETLVIPLYGRKLCSERFPELFYDKESERLVDMIDFDFKEKGKKMDNIIGLFGCIEVAQRQYDLAYEVSEYLKEYPEAAVVNLGCGLDTTFQKVDNVLCHGCNFDFPGVIEMREKLLPSSKREENIACDLNDFSWMDRVDGSKGAVFFAAGVFYYFQKEQVKALFTEMAKRFPKGVLVFDACNSKGVKMMLKTWIKEAEIKDVGAYFAVEDLKEIEGWSPDFSSVTSRGYMTGYRDLGKKIRPLYRFLSRFGDNFIKMRIVKIVFKGE
ncbi:MAG: class I SAM-dependent methyltransferase [Erysipelotrichaceae bacterium]|nr:class I SAM-dependent methyltransferase [Erysipelotrichaceae bacterium]